jgi:hypothetical protein
MRKTVHIAIAALVVCLCDVSISKASEKQDAPVWIDSVILEKLQKIKSIDRSKYKFNVRVIANTLSQTLTGLTAEVRSSKSAVPELVGLNEDVIVVRGKTRKAFDLDGKHYPAGLNSEVVYNKDGNVVASSIWRPYTDADFGKKF